MSDAHYDLLGKPLTDTEVEVLDVYRRLEALAERDDVAPCVQANAKHALAALWQAVVNLDIEYRPETLGEP